MLTCRLTFLIFLLQYLQCNAYGNSDDEYIDILHIIEDDVKPAIFGSNSYNAIKNIFEPCYNDNNGGVKKNGNSRPKHLVAAEEVKDYTTRGSHPTYNKKTRTKKYVITKYKSSATTTKYKSSATTTKYKSSATTTKYKSSATITKGKVMCGLGETINWDHAEIVDSDSQISNDNDDDNKKHTGSSDEDNKKKQTTSPKHFRTTSNLNSLKNEHNKKRHPKLKPPLVVSSDEDWWSRKRRKLLRTLNNVTNSNSIINSTKASIMLLLKTNNEESETTTAASSIEMPIVPRSKQITTAKDEQNVKAHVKVKNHVPLSNWWSRRQDSKKIFLKTLFKK